MPIFAPMLCREIGVAGTGKGSDRRYLAAATMTGPRTVDLSKLVRIQRVIIPGKFGNSLDLLVVTDVHRLRIGLVSPAAAHPGPDLDDCAGAALLDTDPDTAAAHLRHLAAEYLVQQPVAGRYVLHDLVRAYAVDRAGLFAAMSAGYWEFERPASVTGPVSG